MTSNKNLQQANGGVAAQLEVLSSSRVTLGEEVKRAAEECRRQVLVGISDLGHKLTGELTAIQGKFEDLQMRLGSQVYHAARDAALSTPSLHHGAAKGGGSIAGSARHEDVNCPSPAMSRRPSERSPVAENFCPAPTLARHHSDRSPVDSLYPP